MKALLESDEFRAELPHWALRGFLCALTSAGWAVLMGFQAPTEIAGMLTGIAFWVGSFTALSVWTPLPWGLTQPQLGAALKRAVDLKLGGALLGWLLLAGASQLRVPGAELLALLACFDVLLGLGALWLVAHAGSFPDLQEIPRADSFGWTALATLVEGALMAVLIAVIAAAVLSWWRFRARAARARELSSSRPMG